MLEERLARGDIVDFVIRPQVENNDIQVMRNKLAKETPYKLIILRELDTDLFLVAICKAGPICNALSFETNKGALFVKTLPFFSIDRDSLVKCKEIRFRNFEHNVVAKIYDDHYVQIEKCKKRSAEAEEKRKHRLALRKENRARKREQARQKSIRKRERKRNAALERRKLEMMYENEYELAIISNNKKRMKEIESIVGYAPNYRDKNPARKKSSCSISNPRPFQGGRFSPK